MIKNILILGLFLVVVLETGYIGYTKIKTKLAAKIVQTAPAPRPMMATKGQLITQSGVANFVYKVFPGDLSPEAKAVLTGFDVKSVAKADGSTEVTLTPKDANDQRQVYTLQSGQILYFVELTPADDQKAQDLDVNYRDDYGIITDSAGIIQ